MGHSPKGDATQMHTLGLAAVEDEDLLTDLRAYVQKWSHSKLHLLEQNIENWPGIFNTEIGHSLNNSLPLLHFLHKELLFVCSTIMRSNYCSREPFIKIIRDGKFLWAHATRSH